MIRARSIAITMVLPLAACTCGDKKEKVPDPFADWTKLFDLVLKDLPEAKVDQPLEVIPGDLPWLMASPDPEAWRAWAAGRPFVEKMMDTPLLEDVRLSELWLSIEGLRHRAARAASFRGDADDQGVLWRGPTAAGADDLGTDSPRVIIAKRIDPAVRSLVRLAAAFALVKSESVEITEKEVGAIKVRTLTMRGEGVSFALFRNLLIAGNDASLVERAAGLAQKSPIKAGDVAASGEIERGLLPKLDTPGIHVAAELEGEITELFGLEAIGLSLVADPAAPLIFRRIGGEAPGSEAIALLRYAPEGSFAAIVDGAKPGATVIAKLKSVIESDVKELSAKVKKKKKLSDLTELDLEGALADKLAPGTALILGAAQADGDLGAILAFRHGDQTGIEPAVRKLVEGLTGKKATRTVLEDQGGAIVISPEGGGPGAAITGDAVLFALYDEELRRAIAAGAGKAPSLKDRAGVDLAGQPSGGIYVDLAQGGAFLAAFYKDAYQGDDQVTAAEIDQVLGPTFDALKAGGAFFARLEGPGTATQGPLRVLP